MHIFLHFQSTLFSPYSKRVTFEQFDESTINDRGIKRTDIRNRILALPLQVKSTAFPEYCNRIDINLYPANYCFNSSRLLYDKAMRKTARKLNVWIPRFPAQNSFGSHY